MINLSEIDRFLIETKCEILKRNCKNCAKFSHIIKIKNECVYITLMNVTYSGEIYQKDIYVPNLLKMNEQMLKRYAESYLNS